MLQYEAINVCVCVCVWLARALLTADSFAVRPLRASEEQSHAPTLQHYTSKIVKRSQPLLVNEDFFKCWLLDFTFNSNSNAPTATAMSVER